MSNTPDGTTNEEIFVSIVFFSASNGVGAFNISFVEDVLILASIGQLEHVVSQVDSDSVIVPIDLFKQGSYLNVP